jgi:beta-lactamase regulating signal transducer with metallopeptidase domain
MQTLLEVVLSNAIVAAVLALVVAGLSALCRQPALTHRLWLLVLLKLVTPPLVLVHLPWPVAPELAAPEVGIQPAVLSDEMVADVVPGPEAELLEADWNDHEATAGRDSAPRVTVDPVAWAPYVVAVWLAIALLWLGWNGYHLLTFRRCLRRARPAPPFLQNQAQELAEQLGLRYCPPVLLVPGAVPPMVWGGGWGLRLLFPAALLEQVDEEQRASLLLHELAHIRRRDHWVRLLELVVVPLYWWHPVVWWARRELHEAEEQCCDAWVVWALAGSGRTYALALLQTLALCAKVRSPLPLAASGIGQVPHLRRRLTMIMQARTPRTLSRVGAVAVLGLGLLLLPLLPVAGQVPNRDPAPDRERAIEREKDDNLRRVIRLRVDQDGDEVTGDDATSKEIEKLRQLLRALEEKKRAAKDRRDTPAAGADAEAVKKAREEIARLKVDVSDKAKQLAEAEARLAEAAARLGKLEGSAVRGRVILRTENRVERGRGSGTPAPRGDRMAELEERLEKVLRDVEALRRDLRSGREGREPERRPVPPAPPAPPAPPPPPPVPRSGPAPDPAPAIL